MDYSTRIDSLAEADDVDSVGSGAVKLEFQVDSEGNHTLNLGNSDILAVQNVFQARHDDRYVAQTRKEKIFQSIEKVLDHLFFRLFTMMLIIVDVILIIIDLTNVGNRLVLEILTLVIVLYFFVEVQIQLLVKGRRFLTNWIYMMDYLIVFISMVCTVITVTIDVSGNARLVKLLVAGRLVRIFIIVRLVCERKNLQKASRYLVSQNKRRYQKDGFDLDLCYVTERVIAMSFPSKGLMALYRNPIREVAQFFEVKHKDHFKIFNLCSERMYDESLFNYSVERIRIDDHNVPKLGQILHFIRVAREWMEADPQNVIAIHCKGGKGRTGTMVCIWLIEDGTFTQAQDSLEYFGERRTDQSVGKAFQGVQTPSQSRYVGYFQQIKTEYGGNYPPQRKLYLNEIIIKNVSGIGVGNGSDLSFTVILENRIWEYILSKQDNCKVALDRETSNVTVTLKEHPLLVDDVKIKFFCASKVPSGYDKSAFYFWFHTSFVEGETLEFTREELDNAHKEHTWEVYREGFGIQLQFSDYAKSQPLYMSQMDSPRLTS